MNKLIYIMVLLFCLTTSCKKYLDAKPDKALNTVTTLTDAQALLDNNSFMNSRDISLGEASADNYYVLQTVYDGFIEAYKNTSTWKEDIFTGIGVPNEWTQPYTAVYYANTALESIGEIERTIANYQAWDNVKGSALFFRAYHFLKLAWTFSKAYNEPASNNDLGIPLRLHSDFNEVSVRSSVTETYNRIIEDAKAAIPLLPNVAANGMRPSKPATYALLARVYLSMGKFDLAKLYADSCLSIKSDLLDYNSSSMTVNAPFARFNAEVLIHFQPTIRNHLTSGNRNVDTTLYNSYNTNDWRKTGYFTTRTNKTLAFKGGYTSSNVTLFTGIATDEIYFIRAECLARTGFVSDAMTVLNTIMKKRWKSTVTFPTFTATNAADAVRQILDERRKELLFRDVRWSDIKRLNVTGANITITRLLGNPATAVTITGNDNRFALPLPYDVISIANMQQNPR